MTLDFLDSDLTLCKEHILKHAHDSKIQDYLTKFMLIHLSSEYDKVIKKSLSNKASSLGHPELVSFVDDVVSKRRNFDIDDIKEFLNKFDSRRGALFDSSLIPEYKEQLSRIIFFRHRSAHGSDNSMAIQDIIDAHQKAKDVISNFQDALFHSLR